MKWETYLSTEWHPIHRETGIGLTQAFVDYVNQGGPHFEVIRRKLLTIRELHDYCGYLIGQEEVMYLMDSGYPEGEEEPRVNSDAIRFSERRVCMSRSGGERYQEGTDTALTSRSRTC